MRHERIIGWTGTCIEGFLLQGNTGWVGMGRLLAQRGCVDSSVAAEQGGGVSLWLELSNHADEPALVVVVETREVAESHANRRADDTIQAAIGGPCAIKFARGCADHSGRVRAIS